MKIPPSERADIYINTKDRYPCGSVSAQDREKVLSKLEELFGSLKLNGEKIIKSMHRKEDIYSGPCLDQAPDLILVAERGFNLKASIKADRFLDRSIFTGKHTQDSAFLLVKGIIDKSIVPDYPWVYQVREIMEQAKMVAR